MSHKSGKIAELIRSFEGHPQDPHYLGFFECFNRQQFFEAHEVLEELWLPQRGATEDLFYKGLIQLAGAFVHMQKQRPGPAAALLKLARENLMRFPPRHHQLDVRRVLDTIDSWIGTLAQNPGACKEIPPDQWPRIFLEP